jgi:hypothetical protein
MSRWSPPVLSSILAAVLLFVPSVLPAQVVCSPGPPGPPPVLFGDALLDAAGAHPAGRPPMIAKVSLSAGPSQGHAACDVTALFKGFLCAGGIPASLIAAFPNLALEVTYTSARIEAKVLDSDSRADQSDILLVSAEYPRGTGTGCEALVLRDDGGSVTGSFPQTASTAEACDGDSDCPVCSAAVYSVRSNDKNAGDNTYTVEHAFLSDTIELDQPSGVTLGAQSGLAADCVAAASAQPPSTGMRAVGDPIAFKIETVDRTGNLVTWPEEPSVDLQQTHLSCSGDACACCLMLSANPAAECAGRPGLAGVPGSGFEQGLCFAL